MTTMNEEFETLADYEHEMTGGDDYYYGTEQFGQGFFSANDNGAGRTVNTTQVDTSERVKRFSSPAEAGIQPGEMANHAFD